MAKAPKAKPADETPAETPIIPQTETLEDLAARMNAAEPVLAPRLDGDDGLEHPLEGLADHPDDVKPEPAEFKPSASHERARQLTMGQAGE